MNNNLIELRKAYFITREQADLLDKYAAAFEGGPRMDGEKPDMAELWAIAPQASQVIAQVLDEATATTPFKQMPKMILLWVTRVLWLLVEATVPQKKLYYAITYWYQILFTITTIMLVITQFGIWHESAPTVAKLFLFLVVLWVVISTIRRLLYNRYIKIWINTMRWVTVLVAALNLAVASVTLNEKLIPPDTPHAKGVILLSILLILGVVSSWTYGLVRNIRDKIRGPKIKRAGEKSENSTNILVKARIGASKLCYGLAIFLYVVVVAILTIWVVRNEPAIPRSPYKPVQIYELKDGSISKTIPVKPEANLDRFNDSLGGIINGSWQRLVDTRSYWEKKIGI